MHGCKMFMHKLKKYNIYLYVCVYSIFLQLFNENKDKYRKKSCTLLKYNLLVCYISATYKVL